MKPNWNVCAVFLLSTFASVSGAFANGVTLPVPTSPSQYLNPASVPGSDWSWVASIKATSAGGIFYTAFGEGALIAPGVVLTSAHSIVNSDGTSTLDFLNSSDPANGPWQLQVDLGKSQINAPSSPGTYENFGITGWLVNPNYDPITLENDLALVFLNGISSYTPINRVGSSVNPGDALRILTYNTDLSGGPLQAMDLAVGPRNTILQTFGIDTLGTSQFVGESLPGAASPIPGRYGGGPAIVWNGNEWLLAGTADYSFGASYSFGVFTDVAQSQQWIDPLVGTASQPVPDSNKNVNLAFAMVVLGLFVFRARGVGAATPGI